MNGDAFFQVRELCPAGHTPDTRATALIEAVRAHPYVTLIDTRHKDSEDVLVVEFVVELPTDPAADIRATQRLTIVLGADEMAAPTVLALRKDFPDGLPHTNLTPSGGPKSL